MSYTKKTLEELNVMDDFLMNALAADEENAVNDTLKNIHTYVKKVKRRPEVEIEYMKIEELMYLAKKHAWEDGLQQGIEQGLQQGLEEGRKLQEKTNRLHSLLVADKRYEDLDRSTKDKEYQESLFLEYGI